MMRKNSGFIILLMLLLCACSGRDKYEPFTPLSKVTESPEREAAIQAALNGEVIVPTAVPVLLPTEDLSVRPTFDEDSFFAEVSTEGDEDPFADVSEPTPVMVLPTETPLPTATRVYDPNIMMYGSSNGMTTYTLQEGEDVICLGRRFNVSVSQLMGLNKLTSPDQASAGDMIYLPRNPNAWSMVDGYGGRVLVRHPAAYTIQNGDTLFSIACYFGDVLPEDIAVQNKLVLGEPLDAGFTITIP